MNIKVSDSFTLDDILCQILHEHDNINKTVLYIEYANDDCCKIGQSITIKPFDEIIEYILEMNEHYDVYYIGHTMDTMCITFELENGMYNYVVYHCHKNQYDKLLEKLKIEQKNKNMKIG